MVQDFPFPVSRKGYHMNSPPCAKILNPRNYMIDFASPHYNPGPTIYLRCVQSVKDLRADA